ncbi:putative odorant receptor 85d [Odontomachus brunneus]|uniref:putative odorant receptor 85d n=1 Tax=Odontomachus brunneus TaxID=486640 RepID=UPI0013F24070|nr:putative odorant receptor 85d [Odontomachus brunneus]
MVDLDTYYIPIFLHIITCEILYMLLIVSQDVLYLTFVQYCCGLLATLRYLLEDTFAFQDNDDDTTKRVARESRCYANVVYSIRRHTEAIQFINIMESLFRLPLFLHMGCIISVISVVGFQVITNAEDMTILARHGIYFCGAVINAFFENWQGQKIIDYSEKVYEYAYNTQWYDMPNATKKLLILIMLRSIKPSQITAGKFIVMSYVNFNAVMRASSSYFMLLQSMQ